MTVIYKISCGDNVYIGQTNNLKRRTLEHKHRAFKASWDNKLYQAIRKQGYFEIDEIDVISELDELDDLDELYY